MSVLKYRLAGEFEVVCCPGAGDRRRIGTAVLHLQKGIFSAAARARWASIAFSLRPRSCYLRASSTASSAGLQLRLVFLTSSYVITIPLPSYIESAQTNLKPQTFQTP